jgi:hypothetical protein
MELDWIWKAILIVETQCLDTTIYSFNDVPN